MDVSDLFDVPLVDLGTVDADGALPAWVVKELERCDRCLSNDMKQDILFEAGIVLRA